MCGVARAAGWRIEHVDVTELAVVAVQLQHVVGVLGEGRARDRGMVYLDEVHCVRPEDELVV